VPELRGDWSVDDDDDERGGDVGSIEDEEDEEGCGSGTEGGRAAQAGRLAFARPPLDRALTLAPAPVDLADDVVVSLLVMSAPRLLLILLFMLMLLRPRSGLLSGLLKGLLRCGGNRTGVGAGAGWRIEVLTMPCTEVAVPTWRDRASSDNDGDNDEAWSWPLFVEADGVAAAVAAAS